MNLSYNSSISKKKNGEQVSVMQVIEKTLPELLVVDVFGRFLIRPSDVVVYDENLNGHTAFQTMVPGVGISSVHNNC